MKMGELKWSKMVYFGFCILMLSDSGFANAASYELEAANSQNASISLGDGTWGDWQHCADYSGANSAPKTFTIYVLANSREYQKALLACHQIQADGNFSSTNTPSSKFFTSPGSGAAEETKTATSLSKLPVGIEYLYESDGTIVANFEVLSAGAVIKGERNHVTTSSRAGYGGTFYGDTSGQLLCDSGYVITGMKLKTLDGDKGKHITGVRIKCTKLIEK